jgi:hypothetical protein
MEVNEASTTLGFFGLIIRSLLFLLLLPILGWLIYWVSNKLAFRKLISKSLQGEGKAFLFVKIPSSNSQKEDSFDEFLRSLHRVLPNNSYFSLEMESSNQFLRFFIVVPKITQHILESQFYAQFPEAEIDEVSDYIPNLASQNSAFEELSFKRASFNPLNTYHQQQGDFLKNFSALLSKTEPGEQVFIQFILKKVGSKFWQRGLGVGFAKLFGKKYEGENPAPAHFKLSQDLYKGKLRIVYVAKDKLTAESKIKTLVSTYKSVKSPFNELKIKEFSFIKTPLLTFKARLFESGDLWMPSEIATLYHFPYSGSVVSNVVQSNSKHAPAPDILPFYGLTDAKEVSFFGATSYRNENRIFGIKRADRRRHLYVVGKTGSGKSRLIELLLISDILNNQGCCLLDPHGDLAEELLKFIPQERINDVVYIDPSDQEFPIGFNPLEPVEDYETRQHLATFFISIFKKLFAASWNPRMEHLIRYITLALLETPDSNVLGIPRMLSDTQFRQRVIMQIKDPVVKGFWTNEFSASAEQFSREAVVPILNKVGQFISNPIVRNMVGQRRNMLDFSKFMNEGKIVLINISKGKLGDENAALLGSMFITKIQQAALARANMPEEQRRDFYFYVDEFQNFATDAFSSILSEARKYHLDLTIAHQYIAQLPEEVKATAFGNVGSIIIFPVGGDDAAYLAKEFTPIFTPDDMINLNLREMYVKMSVDGRVTQPFSAKTIDVPKPTTDYSREILSHSRLTYGKSKVSVENEIAEWTQSKQVLTTSTNTFPEPLI